MADLVPTQAVVEEGRIREVLLGEAVTSVGQLLYYTSGAFSLAKASGTQAQSLVSYMALETGAVDANIKAIDVSGKVDLGSVLTKGVPYYLSATAGAICPYGDLISTNYVTFLGVAYSTSILSFHVFNSRTTI